MKPTIILLAALLLLTCASAEVVVLTKENINDVIGKDEVTFIKFFGPSCNHCKKVAPVFANASDMLKGVVTFAEVNCDNERELCQRFDIKRIPEFFIFQNGANVSRYVDLYTASAMADYAKAYSLPDSTTVNSDEEFENVKSEISKTCLIKTKSNETELAKLVSGLITQYKGVYRFVFANNEKVSPDDSMESVTVYRKGDDKEVFDGNFSSDALIRFFNTAKVMFIGTLTAETIKLYSQISRDKMGILLLDEEKAEEHVANIKLIAKKYRNDLLFTSIRSEIKEVSKNVGLPSKTVYPAFFIKARALAYVHPTEIQANSSTIDAFVEKYLKGEVTPFRKSEPIPKEPTKEGLTTLVGKTLDSYIKKGKDILIYFYAPWCGHCQNFHTTYYNFAKAHGSEDFIVAKIDATHNDYNETLFDVRGFPTVYFIPAGSHEAVQFNGQRTVDDLASFVKKHKKEPVEPKHEETERTDL